MPTVSAKRKGAFKIPDLTAPPKVWKKFGVFQAIMIKDGLENGTFQGKKKKDRYRSDQYKDYKSRDMKRKRDGKRLKAYESKTISSDETSFVNLMLTAAMIKSLRPRKQTKRSVTNGVDSVHEGKVRGAAKLGRIFLTLNKKNKARGLKFIDKFMLDPQLKKWARTGIKVQFNLTVR